MLNVGINQLSKIHNSFVIFLSGGITIAPVILFSEFQNYFYLEGAYLAGVSVFFLVILGLIYYELSLFIESYFIDRRTKKRFENFDLEVMINLDYYLKNWYEFLLNAKEKQEYIHQVINNISFRMHLWIAFSVSAFFSWIIYLVINPIKLNYNSLLGGFNYGFLDSNNKIHFLVTIYGSILIVILLALLVKRIFQLSAFLYQLRWLILKNSKESFLSYDLNGNCYFFAANNGDLNSICTQFIMPVIGECLAVSENVYLMEVDGVSFDYRKELCMISSNKIVIEGFMGVKENITGLVKLKEGKLIINDQVFKIDSRFEIYPWILVGFLNRFN